MRMIAFFCRQFGRVGIAASEGAAAHTIFPVRTGPDSGRCLSAGFDGTATKKDFPGGSVLPDG